MTFNVRPFLDASSLKEAEHVRDSQEKVVQALQQYTYTNYPAMPSKFAELLLRMPELHRVCQVRSISTYICSFY
jgi:nuclear receptor subfamily 5 group A protein 3